MSWFGDRRVSASLLGGHGSAHPIYTKTVMLQPTGPESPVSYDDHADNDDQHHDHFFDHTDDDRHDGDDRHHDHDLIILMIIIIVVVMMIMNMVFI